MAFVLQANANNAACLSEVEFVSTNNLKILFHVSSSPFFTPIHRVASLFSGGILLKLSTYQLVFEQIVIYLLIW